MSQCRKAQPSDAGVGVELGQRCHLTPVWLAAPWSSSHRQGRLLFSSPPLRRLCKVRAATACARLPLRFRHAAGCRCGTSYTPTGSSPCAASSARNSCSLCRYCRQLENPRATLKSGLTAWWLDMTSTDTANGQTLHRGNPGQQNSINNCCRSPVRALLPTTYNRNASPSPRT